MVQIVLNCNSVGFHDTQKTDNGIIIQ